jgi:hypothetical protein
MMIPRTPWLISLSIALPLMTTPAFTQAQSAPATANPPTTASTVPVYKPPMRGAPATRIGGASRGGPDSELILSVLVPESTGLTSRAQPTLYWYSSKALSTPLEFTLNDEQSIKPLVELKVPANQPGIHALKLKYTLKPEVEYSWTIAAVADPDQRAGDTLASGTIQHMPPSATLAAQLKDANPQQQLFLYAQEGFWYDALATLSEQIAAQPANRSLREQRAALLDQIELKAAAAYDRGATP